MLQPAPRNINWTEMYLTADAAKESFTDVRIVTAKSECVKIASDLVFATTNRITNKLIQSVVDNSAIAVHESVAINADGEISVIMNADKIDDAAVWRALDMVAEAMDQLDGSAGVVNLSGPITFTSTEIPWLTH